MAFALVVPERTKIPATTGGAVAVVPVPKFDKLQIEFRDTVVPVACAILIPTTAVLVVPVFVLLILVMVF